MTRGRPIRLGRTRATVGWVNPLDHVQLLCKLKRLNGQLGRANDRFAQIVGVFEGARSRAPFRPRAPQLTDEETENIYELARLGSTRGRS